MWGRTPGPSEPQSRAPSLGRHRGGIKPHPSLGNVQGRGGGSEIQEQRCTPCGCRSSSNFLRRPGTKKGACACWERGTLGRASWSRRHCGFEGVRGAAGGALRTRRESGRRGQGRSSRRYRASASKRPPGPPRAWGRAGMDPAARALFARSPFRRRPFAT